MPRVIKQPDVRKQEILDGSMKLFYEKGYNNTSISDIAKYLNISQGLCYRYFKSKEEIFNAALDYYASKSVDLFESFVSSDKSITEKMKDAINYQPNDVDINSIYHKYYHDAKNIDMHKQLVLKICEKTAPILARELEKAKQKGEISIDDTKTLAYFCIYGDFGMSILNTNTDSASLQKLIGYVRKILEI